MDVAVFSTKPYDRRSLQPAAERHGHALTYLEVRLTQQTAALANGYAGVCAFVNDDLSRPVLELLAAGGTKIVALRSAGFNNVDLRAATDLGLTIARVPAYSPHAVAEHALGLILCLNRKLHRAFNRVREGNFLLDGLLGFDLVDKTVGVIGTGRIGNVFARIVRALGCRVLAFDPYPATDLEGVVSYSELEPLLRESDIVSLHCPLTPHTFHLIDAAAVATMKPGVMLINTSRGALVDTRAVIAGLKSGKIGHLGLDVYEEEADLFFEDLSLRVIQDDVFSRLLTFPNVLITGHQGFFTREALEAIAEITASNLSAFERGEGTLHEVTAEKLA